MDGERKSIKETSSLSQSRKGSKRCYGATRNPESTADYKLVTHTLTLTDTLQGLAIKYGVTVEQIRRVNKLWTNDNIQIFRTINIPVKLNFDSDASIKDSWDKDDNPGTSKDVKGHQSSNPKTKGHGKEHVDPGVHEVNHSDIKVDLQGQSKIKSSNPSAKDASSSSASFNSFLSKFDGQMKTFIDKDKKQRANSLPGLIQDLGASDGKEESKRQKQTDSNHVRLKNNYKSKTRTSISSQSLDEDNSSFDDLFEL